MNYVAKASSMVMEFRECSGGFTGGKRDASSRPLPQWACLQGCRRYPVQVQSKSFFSPILSETGCLIFIINVLHFLFCFIWISVITNCSLARFLYIIQYTWSIFRKLHGKPCLGKSCICLDLMKIELCFNLTKNVLFICFNSRFHNLTLIIL